MAAPRRTKLRAFPKSDEPEVVRSRARPNKPPAKAISARKAAAVQAGGGKIPAKLRKRLEDEPLPRRTHPSDPREKERRGPLRTGKREPKAGRRDDAAAMRDTRSARRV